MDQHESPKPTKNWLDYVYDFLAQWNCIGKEMAISLWAVSMCLIIATLMAGHWVALPHPETADQFRTHAVSLQRPAGSVSSDEELDTSVLAYHFLYEDCPCSRRVLRHVLGRTPLNGATERIVLVSGNDDKSANAESANATDAKTAGYQVDRVAPQDLKTKYGVEAAPLLVVTNWKNEIVYSGGYTTRKQGPDIQDDSIISAIVAGHRVASLPVYGCAVSKELQAILDPLRLKYAVE